MGGRIPHSLRANPEQRTGKRDGDLRAQAVRKGSRLQEGAGQSAARARDGREAGGKARRCGGAGRRADVGRAEGERKVRRGKVAEGRVQGLFFGKM